MITEIMEYFNNKEECAYDEMSLEELVGELEYALE
jgi:hypothetical protein